MKDFERQVFGFIPIAQQTVKRSAKRGPLLFEQGLEIRLQNQLSGFGLHCFIHPRETIQYRLIHHSYNTARRLNVTIAWFNGAPPDLRD